MQMSKSQYDQLRELVQEIENVLDEVRGKEKGEGEDEAYWNNRLGILADVMLEGDIVSEERWGEIGKEHGYDRRGLGGFFTGSKQSMVTIGNDRRAITDHGMERVKTWLRGEWDVQPTKEQQEKYQRILEKY